MRTISLHRLSACGRPRHALALLLALGLLTACASPAPSATSPATTAPASPATAVAASAPSAAPASAASPAPAAAASPSSAPAVSPARSPSPAVAPAASPSAVAAISVPAPTTKYSGAVQTVKLGMAYIPNVQFAPFYVAEAKGYFADEGIKPDYDYGVEEDVVALTAQNQLVFTNAGATTTIIARSQGVPIQFFVNQYQTLPVALFAPQSKGFKSVADLKGHTIGYPGPFGDTYVGLVLLLNKAGLKTTDVNLVNVGFTQAQSVLAGKVDAAVGYTENEPVQVAAQGMPVTIWPVKDVAPEVGGTGMIASQQTLQSQPDLAKRFTRAFLRGLADTINNPDEAFQITLKAVPDAGSDPQVAATQRQVLQQVVDNDWRPAAGAQLGASSLASWQQAQQDMLAAGLITSTTDMSQAVTNAYLP